MIKSILGGKSKNLFDISKVITSNVVKRNGNSLICSSYGTSIGTLGSICPTLKPSDLITISFKCASEGAASNFMSISNTSGGLKIFTSGETFPVSEVGLSAQWYIYNTDFKHRDIPNKTTYSDIQVELGSTATEYVPHELTSYKSIMKVSDVCQLLDKSKYPATHTQLGCTFTNNGDGSFTINGTIQNSGSWSNPLQQITQNLYGHKILLLTNSTSDIVCAEMKFTLQNGSSKWGTYNSIYTVIYDDYKYIAIRIYMDDVDAGKTIDNATVKFQLFDLTEMFGPGNEPKTVAEFKAKFPNDYYPYSPSCFVTSFDERMPCKTKNSFDINAEMHDANKPAYYIEVMGNIVKTNYDISHVGHPYIEVPVEIGETYTFSCNAYRSSDIINVYSRVRYPDNTIVTYIGNGPVNKTFTATQSSIQVCFGLDTRGTSDTSQFVLIYDIQLEKGTTATDYVPYGYV